MKAARIPVVVEVQLRGSSEERHQANALEKVAEHLEGKVIITKLDAQEERDLVLRLGVATVPAFVVFVGGQIAHTYEGSADAAVIEEWVWQLTH